jgi:DnaJ homolog subfamily C member 17
LLDPTAKDAYDRVLEAKKESELRDRKLDAKRKKQKDELEAREREAAKKKYEKSADELLRSELARLQQQGSQYLAEQQERIKQEIARERQQSAQKTASIQSCTLKVKWKPSSKGDVYYTQERLHSILQKYGDITALVVSKKKKKWAIVEFAHRMDAELALSVERGLETCPLELSIIEGQNQPTSAPTQETKSTYQGPVAASLEEYEELVFQYVMAVQKQKRDAELALSVERGLETCPLELSMIEGQNQPMSAPIQE